MIASINESYDGFCKNGLTHEEGIASGVHEYVGEFSARFPDDKGIYT